MRVRLCDHLQRGRGGGIYSGTEEGLAVKRDTQMGKREKNILGTIFRLLSTPSSLEKWGLGYFRSYEHGCMHECIIVCMEQIMKKWSANDAVIEHGQESLIQLLLQLQNSSECP